MKKLTLITLLLFSSVLFAAGGSNVNLYKSYNNIRDVESLKRGAELFSNNCSTCHSVKYLRYSVLSKHLGWTEKEIDEKFMRGRANINDIFIGGMDEKAALEAYNIVPPDLSLIAKSKSPDYIYTYLQAFYTDKNGKNDNFVLKGTSMPNILAGFQGSRKPIYEKVGHALEVVRTEPSVAPTNQAEKLKLELKQERFNETVTDITNFLEFVSEPNKLERYALGQKVILFLLFLLVILIMLKKDYWRDIKGDK